jgi:hypothetical protein
MGELLSWPGITPGTPRRGFTRNHGGAARLYGKNYLVLLRMCPNPTFRPVSLFIRTSSIVRCLSIRRLQKICAAREKTRRGSMKDPRRTYGLSWKPAPAAASSLVRRNRGFPPVSLSCSTRRCVLLVRLREKGAHRLYFSRPRIGRAIHAVER